MYKTTVPSASQKEHWNCGIGVMSNLTQQQNDSLVEYVNAKSGDEGVRPSAENRRQAPVIGASKPGICTDTNLIQCNIFYL
jgi:hypothetical protein